MKMLIKFIVLLLLFASSVSESRGRFEAMGVVETVDNTYGLVIIDGHSYKLSNEAREMLENDLKDDDLENIVGKTVGYQINYRGDGKTVTGISLVGTSHGRGDR